MAVSRERRVGGGRCLACGVRGERGGLSPVVGSEEGMRSRLEPGAKACLFRRTTVGVNIPDLTEEQGDTVRLREKREEGSGDRGRPGQLRSRSQPRSQPSDWMDSLEDARVGNRSTELGGLALSASNSQTGYRLSIGGLGSCCWKIPSSLPTVVSITAGSETSRGAVLSI